jgi:hypothetical protein
MAIPTSEILSILRAHGIRPEEGPEGRDPPTAEDREFPEIGEINEDETVYATSLAEVFREEDDEINIDDPDEPRLREWWQEIERIIEDQREPQRTRERRGRVTRSREPPEPHCAWYCPIHFFGHGWGIYIRESCILSWTMDIASLVDWKAIRASKRSIARQLLRSAFYVFFLHEQFHHKVESLGFRVLIATGTDRYRPYKANVYRRSYLSPACLEESLANAESYRRLGEPRYLQRVEKAIRDGLRDFLKLSIPLQPPGYAEGIRYLSDTPYRDGLHSLQSQLLDGVLTPSTPAGHWAIAPNMITALMDITEKIYVVLPQGARPIFRPTSVDPGATVSTSALVRALTKHYGYAHVLGGKGSHVKLKKAGAQTIIIPGNRPVLAPGIVKHALDAIGGYPISRLPDLLEGRLRADG